MAMLDRQIGEHNCHMQNLSRKRSYSLDNFLAGSRGNMLITGGNKETRRDCIMRQIQYYRMTTHSSVVVFSEDPVLESRLINAAENGNLGKLLIISEKYNNYDFFKGMPLNLISEYFSKAALLRGCRDTSGLLTFTDAFLQILSEYSKINLSSIRDNVRYDNDSIRNATESPDLKDMISSSSMGGSLLRNLVSVSYCAFSKLAYSGCHSGINIRSEINNDCVILINIPKEYYDLFAVYFAMELRSAMNESFKLILDDELMLVNKSMFEVIEFMKQQTLIDVILSFDNIMSVQPEGEDILRNINRQIVFLNGNMPAVNLQQVLTKYGQYTAMKEVQHIDAPPAYIFTLQRGRGRGATTFQRDRVLLQDLGGYEAVLSNGSCSEIMAVKRLIID